MKLQHILETTERSVRALGLDNRESNTGFNYSSLSLTSLDGSPIEVGGDFICRDNELTSLKGGPDAVNGSFDCSKNRIRTLEGGPTLVQADYHCDDNELTSLKGGPTTLGGDFICNNNRLTSLKGGPYILVGDYYCINNKLTSLEDLSIMVCASLSFANNQLTSLKDIHKHIKEMNGNGYFFNNPITSHVLGLLKIKGLARVSLDNKEVQGIINHYLMRDRNILACQSDLLDAGFEEFAKL